MVDVIEKDFVEAEWDDIIDIVDNNYSSFFTTSVPYAKGDKNAYEDWLKSLGGVFEEYAGDSKKTGGDTLEEFQNACKYVYGLMDIAGFEYCAGDKSRDGAFMEWRHTVRDATTCPLDAYSKEGVSFHQECYHNIEIDPCMLNHEFLTCCNFTVDKV